MDSSAFVPDLGVSVEEVVINMVAVMFVTPDGVAYPGADCGMVSGRNDNVFVDYEDGLESGRIIKRAFGEESISPKVDAHVALVL